MIQWEYTQHQGGKDELIITQRQKTGGRVQWGFEKDTLFRLKKKGSEVFYVNEDDVDQEVPFVHPKAKRAERNGGKLLIQSEEAIAGSALMVSAAATVRAAARPRRPQS